MHDGLGIFVPAGRQVGRVWVPEALPESADAIPAGLFEEPGLGLPAQTSSFTEQLFAWATEEELGLAVTPPEEIIATVKGIPFERAMLGVSWLHRELWGNQTSEDHQRGLVDQLAAGSVFAERANAWLSGDQRVVFSEQQLFTLQRLLILHARDVPLDGDTTDEDFLGFLKALVAIPGSMLSADRDFAEAGDDVPISDERWLSFFAGHGGLLGQAGLVHALGSAHHLYEVLANEDAEPGRPGYCPLGEWLKEEYGLSLVELQAFGFAFHAMTNLVPQDITPINEEDFQGTRLADRAGLGLGALTADREWFRKQFEPSRMDERRAAFEVTPFLQRPGLRLADGGILPLAPRATEAWLGPTGAYYRLFDIARAKGDRLREQFTRFNGYLVERYALRLAEEACQPPASSSLLWIAGSVHGDRPYTTSDGEQRTPDIAIDCGTDLVLVEVTSSRLTQQALVDARPDAVRRDVAKVLVEKVVQLSNSIDDLLAARASIPKVDMSLVERVWPLLLTSDGLPQTPTLWSYLKKEAPEALQQEKVQPLTILDLEDMELLFGMVEDGASLVEILKSKTADGYAERQLGVWRREQDHHDIPSSVSARLELAAEAIKETCFGKNGEQ